MKKLISLTLVLALALALAVPAFAADVEVTGLPNNGKAITVVDGVVLLGDSVGGVKFVDISIDGSTPGTLTIFYGNNGDFEVFDTSIAIEKTIDGVANGNISYSWAHACNYNTLVSTATCTAGGWNLMVCDICGDNDGLTYGWQGALGHDYDLGSRVPANESWDEVTCTRCGATTLVPSLALIAANEYLADWVGIAKELSDKFEVAGIPGNGGNVALIAATANAEYVLGYAAGLTTVNNATQALKDAYWAAVEAYDLVFAAVDLGVWIANAEELSAKFEYYGIPGNSANVALIAAIEAAYDVYLPAYNWGIGTTAEVNAATQVLKDAYWNAVEAYNLVFAVVDLNNWINTASGRIDYLKAEGLWNTEPCQDLYFYMVEFYHNVYLPAYNWGIGTTAEVNAAIQAIKDAYWATF